MLRYGLVALLVYAVSVAASGYAHSQELAPPPPELTTVMPAAVTRGNEQTVTLTGANLTDIKEVLFSTPGLSAEVARTVNDRSVELKVTCAADAPVGLSELRVVTTHGVSNCRYLFVDTLPVIREQEPNTLLSQAQSLENLPIGVAGQITGSDRDFFRFYAKAGQKLVFQAIGRQLLPFLRIDDRIGWFDTYLELYDSSGRQIANADDFRARPDAVLAYEFATDGEYIVCVRDAAYRGRNEFVYYLRVGELPLAMNWFPVGGKAGGKLELSLAAINAPERAALELPESLSRLLFITRYLQVEEHATNGIELAVDHLDAVQEQEPNNETDAAQDVALPVAVNGRIDTPGDTDWFRLQGKKGQRIAFEIVARRVGSPLDSVLELYRAGGQRVAVNDDAEARPGYVDNADSRLVYTLPADDTYLVRVRDLARLGGDEYTYRLLIYEAKPDFDAFLVPTDPFITNPRLTIARTIARAIPAGSTTAFRVRLRRLDGLNAPVSVTLKELPEGVEARTVPVAPGQNEAAFTLTASKDLEPGTVVPISVELTCEVNGEQVLREAVALESHSYIADQRQEFPVAVAVSAVSPASPLTIEVNPLDLKIKKGQAAKVTVRCIRAEGVAGAVQVTAEAPPNGISVGAVSLPADKAEAEAEIKVAGNVAPGEYGLVLVGTTKIKNRDVRVYSKLLRVTVEP